MKDCHLGSAVFVKRPLPLNPGQRIALFASYSADGSIKRYVEYYISRLTHCGFRVMLVIACDQLPAGHAIATPNTAAEGVILRENRGFDFGSWSHVLRLMPELYMARSCLLANDSVFGPFGNFDALMDKILVNETANDLLGLTDSQGIMPHVQSYFIHLSRRWLGSDAFRFFMESVQPYRSKLQVINQYEVTLARFATVSGFKAGAVFSLAELGVSSKSNLTLVAWRLLIERGFPFIKAQLLRDNPFKVDISGWERVLTDAGYDTGLITQYLDRTGAE